jgi:hypothetical protein
MAFTNLLIFDATMTRAKDYLKLYNDKRLTAKREIGVVGKNTSDIHQIASLSCTPATRCYGFDLAQGCDAMVRQGPRQTMERTA